MKPKNYFNYACSTASFRLSQSERTRERPVGDVWNGMKIGILWGSRTAKVLRLVGPAHGDAFAPVAAPVAPTPHP